MDQRLSLTGHSYIPDGKDMRRLAIPSKDPWHLIGPNSVHVDVAWNQSIHGRPNQTIAILDTGLEVDAITGGYFENPITPGYDFCSDPLTCNDGNGRDIDTHDPCSQVIFEKYGGQMASHGTACALLAAGKRRVNSISGEITQGPAYGASIMPLRVLDCENGGTSSDIADAIVYASGGNIDGIGRLEMPVTAISISAGSTDGGKCPSWLQSSIDFANQQSVPVFVAVGNNGVTSEAYWLANCKGVIVVGASSHKGEIADYSNTHFHIAAPGGTSENPIKINMPFMGQGVTVYWKGTSMACPIAVGTFLLGQEIFGNGFLTNPTTGPWNENQDSMDCISNGILSLRGKPMPMNFKCNMLECLSLLNFLKLNNSASNETICSWTYNYVHYVSNSVYDASRMYPTTLTSTFFLLILLIVFFTLLFGCDYENSSLRKSSTVYSQPLLSTHSKELSSNDLPQQNGLRISLFTMSHSIG